MTVVGTKNYMAPEMKFGTETKLVERINKQVIRSSDQVEYNAKVDAWSYGICLLQCCLGGKRRTQIGQVRHKTELQTTIDEEVPRVQNGELQKIVSQLLTMDPNKRSYLHELV